MIELNATTITAMHDLANQRWHASSVAEISAETDLLQAALAQHRANYDLWHAEDSARAPLASDHEIVTAKRLIDITNQRRNDLTEHIDELLLASLPSHPARDQSPLHSETPGLMIDRLSILSLKLYHTREEIDRPDAPNGHAERNRKRLATLQAQRADLSTCLDQLWNAVLRGERRFKLYRQLKMYNDPTLNPALYTNGRNS